MTPLVNRIHGRLARAALLASVLTTIASCNDSRGVAEALVPRAARVVLTPAVDTLAPGEVATLVATVQDAAGRELSARAVRWSSSEPEVATVDSLGRVRGVGSGVTRVTAVVDGTQGETRIVVRRVAATLEIFPATIGLGERVVLRPVVRDSAGVAIPLDLSVATRDPEVLSRDTISENVNRATARRMGTATVAVTVDGRELTARVTVGAPRIANVGFAFRDVLVPVGAQRALDVGIFVASGGPGGTEGGRIEWPTEWRTSNAAVVSVDSSGVLTARSEGEAIVTAVSAGVAGAVGVRVLRLPERPVFTALAAGERQTCGLSTGGIAYCWGEAFPNGGYLGLATPWETIYAGSSTWEVASLPLPVRSPVRFASLGVSSSARGGCALTSEGEAYCWNSPAGARPVPGGVRFASISAAALYACGVGLDGRSYCWDRDFGGTLCVGPVASEADPRFAPRPGDGELRFTTLVVGEGFDRSSYVCGLTRDGELYCWEPKRQTPIRSGGTLRFRTVTVGGQTCAITVEGATYCWDGPQPPRNLDAQRVDGGRRFVAAAGGSDQGCGIDEAGATYCWSMRFGVPRATQLLTSSPALRTLVFGSGSARHGCGLTAEGTAYCWGLNQMGALGLPRIFTTARFPGSPLFFPFAAEYTLPAPVMGQ